MNRVQRYLQQSWSELQKVVWPNRETAIRLTVAVIVFSLVLAAVVGVIDYIFTLGIQTLIFKG